MNMPEEIGNRSALVQIIAHREGDNKVGYHCHSKDGTNLCLIGCSGCIILWNKQTGLTLIFGMDRKLDIERLR